MSIQHDKDGEAVCMELHRVTAERDLALAKLNKAIEERDEARAVLLTTTEERDAAKAALGQVTAAIESAYEKADTINRFEFESMVGEPITMQYVATIQARVIKAIRTEIANCDPSALGNCITLLTQQRDVAIEHHCVANAALAKMTQKMQLIQNTADWLTQLVVDVYTHLSNILQVSSTLDASDALEEWRAMEKVCEALSKFIEWRESHGVLLLAVISASKGLDALRKAKGEVKP